MQHRKTMGKKKAEKIKRKEEQRQYREYLESVKEDERLYVFIRDAFDVPADVKKSSKKKKTRSRQH